MLLPRRRIVDGDDDDGDYRDDDDPLPDPHSCKRLSIDMALPKFLLERRGGISFGTSASGPSRPRLEVS